MSAARNPVAALLLITCLVLAGACIFGGDGDSDEAPFPSLTPFPDALTARLHEIRDRVSAIRGLPVYDAVDEGLVSNETLSDYYGASVNDLDEEEEADLEAYNVVLKLLGVIGPDDDLRQIYGEEFSSLVAGVYVPEDDALVLVSAADGELGVQDEITIAHEYVHSFQDGKYDLENFDKEFLEGDLEEDGFTQYSDTLSCLIEGDASLADEQYSEQVFGPNWREQVQAESADDPPLDIDIPEFLVRDFYFNYGQCPEFVRALHQEGGWAAVDAAYLDPPDTTEQVMHIDKYHDRELANTGPPVDLTDDLDGWKLLDSAQFGEFDVFNWAATLTGDPAAAGVAGAGWGSGWVRSYRDENDPSRAIVQLSLGWDTENDLLEFLGVYEVMLEALEAEVELVSEGNVRWTAPGQAGVLFLDDQLERIEIRVATDAEALAEATADLPQFD
jgi:hypothetical protein